MEKENFEEKLKLMTKPEVNQLKHQEMLANAISNAKDKSVVNWWWLSIPLYIIAAMVMKTVFMPGSTLISNIHGYAGKEKYSSLLFFLILPIISIIINLESIRKIHFLSGSPKEMKFLEAVWFNSLMIVISIFILIVYLI
jgi:hypothetical protein